MHIIYFGASVVNIITLHYSSSFRAVHYRDASCNGTHGACYNRFNWNLFIMLLCFMLILMIWVIFPNANELCLFTRGHALVELKMHRNCSSFLLSPLDASFVSRFQCMRASWDGRSLSRSGKQTQLLITNMHIRENYTYHQNQHKNSNFTHKFNLKRLSHAPWVPLLLILQLLFLVTK